MLALSHSGIVAIAALSILLNIVLIVCLVTGKMVFDKYEESAGNVHSRLRQAERERDEYRESNEWLRLEIQEFKEALLDSEKLAELVRSREELKRWSDERDRRGREVVEAMPETFPGLHREYFPPPSPPPTLLKEIDTSRHAEYAESRANTGIQDSFGGVVAKQRDSRDVLCPTCGRRGPDLTWFWHLDVTDTHSGFVVVMCETDERYAPLFEDQISDSGTPWYEPPSGP